MVAKHNTQHVTVTLERDLLESAREADINMSETLAAALDIEFKKRAALQWREANAGAIAALNALGEEIGCFSDEYRSF